MIKALRRILDTFYTENTPMSDVLKNINELKVLEARQYIRTTKTSEAVNSLHDVEFKVFSQFGDDGIIQYLIHKVKIDNRSFVEIGVENYTESNTRFLLVNDNWRGLVMDGNSAHIRYIRKDEIYWRHDLTAIEAFVSRENINQLLTEHRFAGEIGILSIDIDGNDYWVWECVTVVQPIIVVIEYNSNFGDKMAVSIPYDPTFYRTAAHYSNLYWGCSLKALVLLAKRKGYVFVGSNGAGNNAYFVRRDKLGPLKRKTVAEGYVESKFRQSRDRQGNLTYLSGMDCLATIRDMPIVDVTTNSLLTVEQIMR
jgi:hypothetical protein